MNCDDEGGELYHELRALLNRHSVENRSNTPDFALAVFLLGCLEAFERAMALRDLFSGRRDEPEVRDAKKDQP